MTNQNFGSADPVAAPALRDVVFRVATAAVPLLLLGVGLGLPLLTGLLDMAQLSHGGARLLSAVLAAVLGRTLLFAAISGGIATIVAWTFALITTGWPRSYRTLLLVLCVLPVATHFILRTYGLQQIFGAGGPMNSALIMTGLIVEPLPLTKSAFGTVMALTSWLLPVSVFFMYMVVRSVPRELIDAAVLLGAGRAAILRNVWLPQTTPGAMLLLTINFCLGYGTYLSPRLLGGLEDVTVVVLIGQLLNEGRSAQAAMVGTIATAIPLVIAAIVFLARRIHARSRKLLIQRSSEQCGSC